jgi:hypothetical protein
MTDNERNIVRLLADSAKKPGTFDAYSCLAFAERIAKVNDNFAGIAHVLLPDADKPFSYGNADAIKTKLMQTASLITLSISATDDNSKHIKKLEKYFQSYFTGKGFKIIDTGQSAYHLDADFEQEDSDLSSASGIIYISWTLDSSITDKNGKEVFSWSGEGRNGHRSRQMARQVVYRVLQKNITDESTDDGFAHAFATFLDGLVK